MPRSKEPIKIAKGIRVVYNATTGQRSRIRFEVTGQTWTEAHPSEREAVTFAKAWAAKLAAGENIVPVRLRTKAAPPQPVAVPGTLRVEGNEWLIERQRRKAAGTNSNYASLLTHHIYPLLGDHLVRDGHLTRRVCIDFAKTLVGRVSEDTGKPLAHNTRLGIIRVLGNFCRWARDQHPETFPYNPADDLVEYVLDPDELPKAEKFWTHAEAQRLLEACLKLAPHWYPFLFFAIRTGLRFSELIELHWEEDFAVPGHVFVQRQFKRFGRRTWSADARGRLVGEVDPQASRVTPLKNRKRRIVPLRPDVERLMDLHQKAQALKQGRPANEPRGLCFLGRRGGRVSGNHFERTMLPKLCKAAKVRMITTSIHTTRHTFATVLLNAGVDIAEVSKWLGHANQRVTEDIYKHAIRDPRRDKQIAALVDDAWAM